MFAVMAFVVIRVLAIIGFTMLPITLFNLWFREELPSWQQHKLEWFRVSMSVVIGSLALSIMLAFCA